jgi:hypothetical protein
MQAYATQETGFSPQVRLVAGAAPLPHVTAGDLVVDQVVGQLAELVAERVAARLAEPQRHRADEWLDSRRAAEDLGIGRDSLRRLAAEGSIPTEQAGVGCKLFFRRSDLDAWRCNARRPIEPLRDAVMADPSTPRRVRVERGIYRRPTGVLEVAYTDEVGRVRWRTVEGGILAARKVRDDLSARRARGESIGPKPRLRLGEAAEAWLAGPVLDLRDTTHAKYRCIVHEHLRPRFHDRRLDAITADELAQVVRELRGEGKSEATIAVVLSVISRIYKFAARTLEWSGTIPNTLMLRSERPKVSLAKRRPIFTGEQLEQTIGAAHEPFRTLYKALQTPRWSFSVGPRRTRRRRVSALPPTV